MKFFLALTLVVLAVAQANAGRNSRERPSYQTPAQYFITGVNNTVQAILQSLSTAQGSTYLWDLIPLTARFVLLNQTAVQQLPYNITDEFLKNNTNLSWATLPSNVQSLLKNEQVNLQFLNLTLAQLGVVDSTSTIAGYTIYQLLNPTCQALLPNVTALLSQVSIDTQVNATALVLTLASLNPYYSYRYSGSRSFGRLFGKVLDPSRAQAQFNRLYTYLNSGTANSRCYLRSPLGALGELAERCFYTPRQWRW